MTRRELEQLEVIVKHLRMGAASYRQALDAMFDLCEVVQRELAAEDMVNTSLEQSQGTGDDSEPIRKARH